MSRTIKKEITCPACGEKADAKMWASVNVTLDQELRESVLDESLFTWTCPQCGHEALLSYPCLYHDMANKFMIYLVPGAKQESLNDAEAENRYPELGGVTKRLAADLNEMKEKILIFENGLDDRAVELTKLAMSKVALKKHGKELEKGYFCAKDGETGHLAFTFFVKDTGEPYHKTTRMEAYEKSREVAKRYSGQSVPPAGFLRIGASWAQKALESL